MQLAVRKGSMWLLIMLSVCLWVIWRCVDTIPQTNGAIGCPCDLIYRVKMSVPILFRQSNWCLPHSATWQLLNLYLNKITPLPVFNRLYGVQIISAWKYWTWWVTLKLACRILTQSFILGIRVSFVKIKVLQAVSHNSTWYFWKSWSCKSIILVLSGSLNSGLF